MQMTTAAGLRHAAPALARRRHRLQTATTLVSSRNSSNRAQQYQESAARAEAGLSRVLGAHSVIAAHEHGRTRLLESWKCPREHGTHLLHAPPRRPRPNGRALPAAAQGGAQAGPAPYPISQRAAGTYGLSQNTLHFSIVEIYFFRLLHAVWCCLACACLPACCGACNAHCARKQTAFKPFNSWRHSLQQCVPYTQS